MIWLLCAAQQQWADHSVLNMVLCKRPEKIQHNAEVVHRCDPKVAPNRIFHQPAGFAVVVLQRHAQRHGGSDKKQLNTITAEAEYRFKQRIATFQSVACMHGDTIRMAMPRRVSIHG